MPTTISISGNLRAGSATIASANVVTPQGPNVVPLNDRRNDAAQSLNFILPAAQTAVGSINLSLISAIETGNHTVHHPGNTLSVAATFQQMPPLRIRLLGMRYAAVPSNAPPGSPAQSFVPSNFDFSMIVSWLRRAYPVASVISSQVIVDSNHTPPFDCNQVNAQVAAIRMQDMQAGGDPFTHYFGLVGDGNGLGFWMRGCS